MKIRFKNVSALALAGAMMFSTWSPSIVHAANFELGSHVIKDEQSPTGYTAQFAIDSKEIDKIEEEANRGEVTKVELTGGFTYVDPEADRRRIGAGRSQVIIKERIDLMKTIGYAIVGTG